MSVQNIVLTAWIQLNLLKCFNVVVLESAVSVSFRIVAVRLAVFTARFYAERGCATVSRLSVRLSVRA